MGSQPGTKVPAVTNSRHCRNELQHSILSRLSSIVQGKENARLDNRRFFDSGRNYWLRVWPNRQTSYFLVQFLPRLRLCTYLHELSLLFFSQSWLFFEKTPRPWFKEHGLVSFPNTGSPLEEYNYAFCKVSVAPFGKSGLRGCRCVHVVHW